MRKKLFLILLSFSLVFLFLTMHQVYGEVWNNAETFYLNSVDNWHNMEVWTFSLNSTVSLGWHNTEGWSLPTTRSPQITDLLLAFTALGLLAVFSYAYWFRIRNPKNSKLLRFC